ncbi:metal-dependent hydrolase [Massilia sp. DWR3-1-1]|uniref:metal-dependent hydrolase n=1 Tax=Massilia sp. DWR3-1-1 TaxID=2804559 RepID=UPI003CE6B6D7
MDNLTHTIVGLAVGELLHRSVRPEAAAPAQQTRRRLLLTACACASNFPDLDLVLVKLLPAPLGYLLHHRGHTHTLLLEIPQALLLCALLWLLWPAARHLLSASAPARGALAGTVIGGFLLHIGMDSMNSYGIHPFYPFDMRWLYGDLVFIVEPLFWLGAGVPLLMTIGRRPLRWALALLLAALLGACALAGLLHWASLVLLAAVGMAAAGAARAGPRQSLLTGLGLCLVFIGMQALGSATARARLVAELGRRAPSAVLVDVALTAYPANPLCWSFAAIERARTGDTYHVRRGVLSLAPALLPVTACPAALTGALTTVDAQLGLGLLSDNSASLQALRRRAATDCWLHAWLRFARTPLLDGATASDLRFGTTVASNFTAIDLDLFKDRACPAPLPPWDLPRADLLAP